MPNPQDQQPPQPDEKTEAEKRVAEKRTTAAEGYPKNHRKHPDNRKKNNPYAPGKPGPTGEL